MLAFTIRNCLIIIIFLQSSSTHKSKWNTVPDTPHRPSQRASSLQSQEGGDIGGIKDERVGLMCSTQGGRRAAPGKSLGRVLGGSSKSDDFNISLHTTCPTQECPKTYFLEKLLKTPYQSRAKLKIQGKKY